LRAFHKTYNQRNGNKGANANHVYHVDRGGLCER